MVHRAELRPIEILLVEDSPSDVRLTREVFRQSTLIKSLIVVRDGVEALDYLHRRGAYVNATRPDLVLLDLNLPRKGGQAVLADVKSDPELRRIPVVVLSTSNAERDVKQSYDLHANCYLVKPVDLAEFTDVVRAIEDFWISHVRLPEDGS